MTVGKQYTVVHPFERVDPKGKAKRYEAGDTYSGEDTEKYLADPNEFAPDHGPLIAEKTDSPVKEK